MNLKFFLLSMTVISLGAAALPANAEGQRWDYAPNVYGPESHQHFNKHPYIAPHAVTPGAMPKSSVFLGVNPALLKPRPVVAPMPTQAVQAAISIPQVQAAPFRNDFGAPISEQKAAPTQMAMAHPGSAPHFSSSHDGHATLRTPRHTTSQVARPAALPAIAGYGPGMGYQAGPTVPSSYGSGQNTSTAVSGVIRGHH
jgi:hypothetical protein